MIINSATVRIAMIETNVNDLAAIS